MDDGTLFSDIKLNGKQLRIMNMAQAKNTQQSKNEAATRSVGVQRLVRNAGQSYYFSHETVKQYEAGEIEFVDKSGHTLKPSYFGAGLSGMNGTLKAS
jgi:hypothetical protein